MTAKIETTSFTIDPRQLTLLTKNARRMPQTQFKRLVENIKADGTLTSVPLVHRAANDKLVVLSGNHRVKASVAAGLEQILVMEVKGDLDADKLLAIQLSHNALVGEDDQNILRELYDSLDVMGKLYSGLTDANFGGVEDLDLAKLTISAPIYEEVRLMFLPEDRETFVRAMEALGKGAAKAIRYVGRLADFERFEQALVAVQDTLKIHNQALALSAMSELALERLAQLEIEANGPSDTPSEAGEGPADDQDGIGGAAGVAGNPVNRRAKTKRQPDDSVPVHQEAPPA